MGRIIVKRSASAISTMPNIVCIGDSITYGSNSTTQDAANPSGGGYMSSYPYKLAATLGLVYDDTVHNLGTPGIGTPDLIDPDYLLRAGYANHLLLMAGINDILNGPFTATATFARLQAYAAARAAAGWIVTVATITNAQKGSTSARAEAVSYNALIRANFNRVVDLGADANIGLTSTNPSTYITGDNVHLTNLGNATSAALWAAFLQTGTNLQGPAPASIPVSTGNLGRDASLTGDFREWMTLSVLEDTLFDWFNCAKPRAFQSSLTQNDQGDPPPHVYATRVANGLGGKYVARFAGDVNTITAYMGNALVPMSAYITTTSWLVTCLIKPTAIATNTGVVYSNEGVWADSGVSSIGCFLKVVSGTYYAVAYANPGDYATNVSVVIPAVNTWIIVACRMTAGKLGISINGGTWTEVTCGAITDLTGGFRIGTNPSASHSIKGDIAALRVRNAYSTANEAIDLAYLHARFGV